MWSLNANSNQPRFEIRKSVNSNSMERYQYKPELETGNKNVMASAMRLIPYQRVFFPFSSVQGPLVDDVIETQNIHTRQSTPVLEDKHKLHNI